jgi:cytochrome bd-type quinol oxidase subunit 2
MTVLRTATAVALLLGVYFLLPFDGRGGAALRGLVVVAGLALFGAIFVRQMRQIRDAQYPMLRAVEAIALVATLFVVVISTVHWGLDQATPGSYSEALSRLDSLYFTVTTLGTVGFGDITPTTDATRAVTTVQIVMGVALLGAGIKMMLGVAQRVADERQTDRQ